MNPIDKVLLNLKDCLETNSYISIETDKIELKDLSSGNDWKELYKTICAFLNTRGGTVIIGIHENSSKTEYKLTGFKTQNEEKLKELPHIFTDDNSVKIDLSEYVRPDLFEIKDFFNLQICILYIEKLPEDKKYVLFNGIAYERKLTGDHKIPKVDIEKQKELRTELEMARELQPVKKASLETLNVDKLNDYIQKLNQGVKVETLKADIPAAKSFLERKKFVINNAPTLLGVLVCGENIYDTIGGRAQVDGFVESPSQIAGNKKVYKDNIIPLLEDSIGFVISNISTGISTDKGGSTTFEYPERLIRETVNNALAHRDYSVDKFVNITIAPNKHIEIRNPGKFRKEQILRVNDDVPIRRIIPIPKPHNPRLADVLKSFDRWEGKGWGMSSLTNMALDNYVDLPYYILYAEQDVGLFIPKGSILDDGMELWLRSYAGFILKCTNGRVLSDEQKTALAYFLKSERLNKIDRYTIALTPDNNHYAVINDLKEWNLIIEHKHSPELYPTFIVNRTLVKNDFTNELRDIYGGAFDNLAIHYKDTLNAIYHFNEFAANLKDINAAQIGDFLFFKDYKTVNDVEKFNGFKRKIRGVIMKLTEKKYLIKKDGGRPSYSINKDFKRKPSLFD